MLQNTSRGKQVRQLFVRQHRKPHRMRPRRSNEFTELLFTENTDIVRRPPELAMHPVQKRQAAENKINRARCADRSETTNVAKVGKKKEAKNYKTHRMWRSWAEARPSFGQKEERDKKAKQGPARISPACSHGEMSWSSADRYLWVR